MKFGKVKREEKHYNYYGRHICLKIIFGNICVYKSWFLLRITPHKWLSTINEQIYNKIKVYSRHIHCTIQQFTNVMQELNS